MAVSYLAKMSQNKVYSTTSHIISISIQLGKILKAGGLFKKISQIILNNLRLRLSPISLVEIGLCKLL